MRRAKRLAMTVAAAATMLVAVTVLPVSTPAATSFVLPANQAATNLPTSSKYPGAQNPPYVCCWNAQGQFVTFSFSLTAAGSTTFQPRYSAGSGRATRRIELDGSVLAANLAFPSTGSWSKWATITVTATLGSGSHTFKIWFDDASKSRNDMNLDNLTVSQSTTTTTTTSSTSSTTTSTTTTTTTTSTTSTTTAGVPVNTGLPVISGTPQQGQTLKASTGTWTNSPTSYAYQWNRCTTTCTVASTAGSSYLLTSSDVGATMTVTVTASNSTGASAPATSAATATVTAAASTQTLPANQAATNLPTETVWSGAQNPPYICCWSSQGQYVTFSFSVPATGSTTLSPRYSAGNGLATRKIELDGAVIAPNQSFPATANWNTWTTITVTASLTAGTHTFKIWFDSTAGSNNFINLDNLTVSQSGSTPPPPNGLVVSVGYASSATGLSPWQGSPNTIFIGESAQCCVTLPSYNGNGYDAGAIEISNPTSGSITVSAVTVDFSGSSSPSHFDLWGGGTTGHLPLSLSPGQNVVLTMTSGFNFDTSDLAGKACFPNTGYVGTVHVTVNGATTDYRDSHQVLTADGTDLEQCPNVASEQKPFTTVVPGDQPAAAPVMDLGPSLVGTPIQNRVLSAFAGAWNASPPPTVTMQWRRCDTSGANCTDIGGANAGTYVPTAFDVGSTLRVRATATNPSGGAAADTPPTAVIQSGPTVAQLGWTRTGGTGILVGSAVELGSVFTAAQTGSTIAFEFYGRGAGNTQTFTPKVYASSNGVKGALLATGASITVQKGSYGQWYVAALSGLPLSAGSQYFLALDSSGVFNGTYLGTEIDGTMSFFLDYTPA